MFLEHNLRTLSTFRSPLLLLKFVSPTRNHRKIFSLFLSSVSSSIDLAPSPFLNLTYLPFWLLYPEHKGDMYLPHICKFLPDYTALNTNESNLQCHPWITHRQADISTRTLFLETPTMFWIQIKIAVNPIKTG